MLKALGRINPDEAVESAVLDGVLWLTVHGPLDRAVGDALMTRLKALSRSYQLQKRLLDFRSAPLLEGAVALIGRVKAVEMDDELREGRTAIVCSVRNSSYAFLESTAAQYGHELQVFTDGARAMRWLQGDSPP